MRNLGVILSISGALLFPSDAGAVAYTAIDLGTLGGTYSAANGINNSGQIVGTATLGSEEQRAFLYSGGSMTNLGTLGGFASQAYGISSTGIVTGSSKVSTEKKAGSRAFSYSGGVMSDLGSTDGPAAGASSGRAVNSSGIVGGSSSSLPAFYSGGVWTTLSTTTGSVYGINDASQMVGSFLDEFGEFRAFMYDAGVTTDLGSLAPGSYSAALAVNASGVAAGYAASASFFHAVVFSGGGLTDIGLLLGGTNSYAFSINASGQVVGNYDSGAYLYSGGVVTQLATLVTGPSAFTSLSTANGINDLGWIVGEGIVASGETHAFLLTPVEEGIPEPAAGWLVAAGAALLVARRKNAR